MWADLELNNIKIFVHPKGQTEVGLRRKVEEIRGIS